MNIYVYTHIYIPKHNFLNLYVTDIYVFRVVHLVLDNN